MSLDSVVHFSAAHRTVLQRGMHPRRIPHRQRSRMFSNSGYRADIVLAILPQSGIYSRLQYTRKLPLSSGRTYCFLEGKDVSSDAVAMAGIQ